ncbi:MFS transporter [Nocardia sp. NPDC127579]|uniref:MFS transporter n=1 Tax=Nocardia sp. NPDC127579 TaxID=3345402 RepID=UPI00362F8784
MFRLASLMFCVFTITTGEFVVAGLLPRVAADLEVTVGTAGLLITAYALGMIVGGPVLTALTAASERKRLMQMLLVVAVLGNAVSALAPEFAPLLIARVLTASVTSTFFAQAIVVAVGSAPPGRAGGTVARLVFGMNLAMILGAPLGTLIGGQWGWRATFWAIALAGLVGLALVSVLVEVPPAQSRTSAVTELAVLRRGPVLLALTVTAVGNLGVLMVFSYLAPLAGLAGHALDRLPLLLLGYGVGAAIGNLAGGILYDRNPVLCQPVLLGLLAAALVATWFVARMPVPSAVAVVVIGALAFAVIPGMQARVLRTAAAAPTLAMAVNASGYQVAAAGAGLLGGLITDSAGPRHLYLVAAGFTLCGLSLTLIGTRANRLPRSSARVDV